MSESVEVTKRQARAIFALVFEQSEIVRNSNVALAEIKDAIEDQLEMLRLKLQMPEGKYQLVQEGETLRLQLMPEPEPAAVLEHPQRGPDTDFDVDGRREFADLEDVALERSVEFEAEGQRVETDEEEDEPE